MLETEQEDLPYSREELLASEQTRGFSYAPNIPSAISMSGPTQARSMEVLSSYEEMTVDELFNGPSSRKTQPELEQVQVLDDGTAVINGRTVEWLPNDPEIQKLEAYLMEESKPLHTNFVRLNQG